VADLLFETFSLFDLDGSGCMDAVEVAPPPQREAHHQLAGGPAWAAGPPIEPLRRSCLTPAYPRTVPTPRAAAPQVEQALRAMGGNLDTRCVPADAPVLTPVLTPDAPVLLPDAPVLPPDAPVLTPAPTPAPSTMSSARPTWTRMGPSTSRSSPRSRTCGAPPRPSHPGSRRRTLGRCMTLRCGLRQTGSRQQPVCGSDRQGQDCRGTDRAAPRAAGHRDGARAPRG
jgi:hypothetical protein